MVNAASAITPSTSHFLSIFLVMQRVLYKIAASDARAAKLGIPIVIPLTGAPFMFTKKMTAQLMTMQSSENNM